MTREVHGVTGKHKSNVDLHVAGGWCSCCFQGGIGTRAVNKSLLFKPSWGLLGSSRGLLGPYPAFSGPSRGLLGPSRAFSGPSRAFLGLLGPSWVFLGLLGLDWAFIKPEKAPRRPQEGLEKAPRTM